MLEIHSKDNDHKKQVSIVIIFSVIMEAILYAIMSFFEGSLAVFCMVSGLILFMVFLGIIMSGPRKFIIDEDEEVVKLCLQDSCISTIKMNDIKEALYKVTLEGTKSVDIVVKHDPNNVRGISISTPDFSDKDIRSAFERLSALSEKYGFDVEERYESETSSLSSPVESPVPSDMGSMEITEGEVIPSEDLTPYRVK